MRPIAMPWRSQSRKNHNMCISAAYSSPNFNERKSAVSGIVIHYTEEELDDTIRIFLDDKRAKRVSAHYVIDRDGTIYSVVPESKRAWHAGIGYWSGITDLNSVSIGIELVYLPGEEYDKRQISSLIELCRTIQSRHEIKWVIGHSDCAFARGKVDPGPCFPWKRLAQSGIGIWPDGLHHKSSLSNAELLANIGYNTENEAAALQAFILHFCPALTLAQDGSTVREQLEGVHAATTANKKIYISPRQRAWFKRKYDQKITEGKKKGISKRDICRSLRDAVPISSVEYNNIFLDQSKANEKRGRYVSRSVVDKNLNWLGVDCDEFFDADKCAKIDGWATNEQDEEKDFFRLASKSLVEAMSNGDNARIDGMLHLIDSVIFTLPHFTSSQAKDVIFSIGEVLHMCRDRPIPPVSASIGGYDYGWYRVWLWMKHIVSALRKDILAGGRRPDDEIMPGLFVPWCELICVKMLRHKLFMKNVPYPLPSLSSELRTTIRHSFLLCLCDGAEHYFSLCDNNRPAIAHIIAELGAIKKIISNLEEPECRAKALRVIEMLKPALEAEKLDAIKRLSKERYPKARNLLHARIMLAQVMENWGRYLCYSSDKGDRELLEALISGAKASVWTKEMSAQLGVKVDTDMNSEVDVDRVCAIISGFSLEHDFAVRLVSVIADTIFLEARQIDAWKSIDRRLEIRSLLQSACYMGISLEKFVKRKLGGFTVESLADNKVYSDLARKAGYYSRYWLDNVDYFERRGTEYWLLLKGDSETSGDAGALEVVRGAYGKLGLNLPWQTSISSGNSESLDKLYWDFEMEMWVEYDLRLASFTRLTKKEATSKLPLSTIKKWGWWGASPSSGFEEPFKVFAEIVLLYSEMVGDALDSIDHSRHWMDHCRSWAARKLKLEQRIREPRTTKMNFAERLKLSMTTFVRFKDAACGECERYVIQEHGKETAFFNWAESVLSSEESYKWDDVEALRTFVELVLSEFVYLLRYASKVKDREKWYLKKLLKRKGEVPFPWDVERDVRDCGAKIDCIANKINEPPDPPEEKQSRAIDLMAELTPRSVVKLVRWIQLWRPDLKSEKAIAMAIGAKKDVFTSLKKDDNDVQLETRKAIMQGVADILGLECSEILDEISDVRGPRNRLHSIDSQDFDSENIDRHLEVFVRALRNTANGTKKVGDDRDLLLYEKGLDLYFANLKGYGSNLKRKTCFLFEEWKKAKYDSEKIEKEIKLMMLRGKGFYDRKNVDMWFNRTLFSGVGDAVNLLKLGFVGLEFVSINPNRKIGLERVRDVIVRCGTQLRQFKPDWDGTRVLNERIDALGLRQGS